MSNGPDTGPPRVRRGAHRTRRSLVSALMPSVLAVAAVSALVTSLAVWQGDRADRPGTDAAAAATVSASTTAPPASAASTTAAPSATATTTAEAASTTSAQSAVEGTKAERTPEAEKTPAGGAGGDSGAVDRSTVEVVVLNQTSRPGLAASVAAHLRTAGWDVPAVGNFRGTVPSTTVYYPAGGETVALAVARDLRATPRTMPRFGNLSTTRFTVVVTDSYQG